MMLPRVEVDEAVDVEEVVEEVAEEELVIVEADQQDQHILDRQRATRAW